MHCIGSVEEERLFFHDVVFVDDHGHGLFDLLHFVLAFFFIVSQSAYKSLPAPSRR